MFNFLLVCIVCVFCVCWLIKRVKNCAGHNKLHIRSCHICTNRLIMFSLFMSVRGFVYQAIEWITEIHWATRMSKSNFIAIHLLAAKELLTKSWKCQGIPLETLVKLCSVGILVNYVVYDHYYYYYYHPIQRHRSLLTTFSLLVTLTKFHRR